MLQAQENKEVSQAVMVFEPGVQAIPSAEKMWVILTLYLHNGWYVSRYIVGCGFETPKTLKKWTQRIGTKLRCRLIDVISSLLFDCLFCRGREGGFILNAMYRDWLGSLWKPGLITHNSSYGLSDAACICLVSFFNKKKCSSCKCKTIDITVEIYIWIWHSIKVFHNHRCFFW